VALKLEHIHCLLSDVKTWKLLAQMHYLRRVVEHDVWLIRMASRVVLVIRLGRIKRFQWNYLGHDWRRENFRIVQLRNVGFRDALLFIAGIEDYGAILRTFIRALAV